MFIISKFEKNNQYVTFHCFSYFLFDGAETKSYSNQEDSVVSSYVKSTLSMYDFPDLCISFPISDTKSSETIYDSFADTLNNLLDEIACNPGNIITYSNLEMAVSDKINSVSSIPVLCDYPELTELSLFILLDSYKYWFVDDNFGLWVTNLCTEEQQRAIAAALGYPDYNPQETKGSGTEMRAWSEMAQNLDANSGGFLSHAIQSDAYGTVGALVGGALFGGLGVASALFGAAWSSIGTIMGM